jgi:hypothetical protein
MTNNAAAPPKRTRKEQADREAYVMRKVWAVIDRPEGFTANEMSAAARRAHKEYDRIEQRERDG